LRSLSDEMVKAIRDYRFFLDRGYPGPSTLELIGNRYRLGKEERLILFRAISSVAASNSRKPKLRHPLPGETLLLDVYNVAFGIIHYLVGKPCFLSTDGLMRDAGASYGRVQKEELLIGAFQEIAETISCHGIAVEAFLDAPVSKSAAHATALSSEFMKKNVKHEIETVASADGRIRAMLRSEDTDHRYILASADSALVDEARAVWDLGAELLASRYGAELIDIGFYL
jgi:hypothetical protein